jgi:hypothetical protein
MRGSHSGAPLRIERSHERRALDDIVEMMSAEFAASKAGLIAVPGSDCRSAVCLYGRCLRKVVPSSPTVRAQHYGYGVGAPQKYGVERETPRMFE